MVQGIKRVNEKYEIYPTIIIDAELAPAQYEGLGIEDIKSSSKVLAETCQCIIVRSDPMM